MHLSCKRFAEGSVVCWPVKNSETKTAEFFLQHLLNNNSLIMRSFRWLSFSFMVNSTRCSCGSSTHSRQCHTLSPLQHLVSVYLPSPLISLILLLPFFLSCAYFVLTRSCVYSKKWTRKIVCFLLISNLQFTPHFCKYLFITFQRTTL